MAGFIDLHLHYVPGVDDGVRSVEEGLKLCSELKAIGFDRLVTTPHIRSGMFENRRDGLSSAFEAFRLAAQAAPNMPVVELSAEHHCDSVFLDLMQRDELLPYPGSHAILIEFAYDNLPLNIEQITFRLAVKRLRPILAHPERYTPLFRKTDPIERLLDQEVGLQLDVMALTGKYGRAPRAAAERMLEEGVYTIAASDAHRPEDVPEVGKAIEKLYKLVGDDEAELLLADNPRCLLEGTPTQ
jgi:protein-tyrosine phosphatase